VGVAAAAIALVQPLNAATDSKPITVSATVSATAKLTLSVATVTFPDADPDTTASIPAVENAGPVSVTAKGKTTAGSNITLTLQAAGDLSNGSDTIPIANVTWTAAGAAGFVGGTMSSGSAVSVGSWLNSGNRTGQLSFFLANSWDYKVGSYAVGATYTLTAP
jgi:hypothetical protein